MTAQQQVALSRNEARLQIHNENEGAPSITSGVYRRKSRQTRMPSTLRPTNSRLLRESMQVTCAPLYAAYDRLWRNDRLDLLVPSFLILMHQIVRASVPLMKLARSRARRLAKTDRMSQAIERYMKRHIDEEQDHDTWLIEDLETIGYGRSAVLAKVPSPTVAAMVGAQYYWIRHHHPVALLGYIRVLEGNAPSAAHVARLRRLSGLPESVFRTYRLHGDRDPTHLRQFESMFDSLELSRSRLELVGASASQTAYLLAQSLEELESAVESANVA
jgi:hypothetical protein